MYKYLFSIDGESLFFTIQAVEKNKHSSHFNMLKKVKIAGMGLIAMP
jgi:hypothetical protein